MRMAAAADGTTNDKEKVIAHCYYYCYEQLEERRAWCTAISKSMYSVPDDDLRLCDVTLYTASAQPSDAETPSSVAREQPTIKGDHGIVAASSCHAWRDGITPWIFMWYAIPSP
jgi:hypothetical protein